ncbi:hypothetical protein V6N13_068588 [Hibiscus sabdariffa]
MGHYASECRSKGCDDEAHLTYATDEEPSLMMAISQEGTYTRRVNNNKKIPEFTIMDPFYSDEANDVTNKETRVENVTPREATEIPT